MHALQHIQTHHLTNGVTLVLDPLGQQPYAVVSFCFPTGSAQDPVQRAGLAHFLEHMMFKGTPRHSEEEVTAWMARVGGTQNALTSYDFTLYHKTVPSAFLAQAIELELDRLDGLLITQRAVDLERSVILNEMHSTQNSWAQLLHQAQTTMLAGTGYAYPVIGTVPTVQVITPDNLRSHFDAHYRLEQLIVSVSGHFEASKLIAQLSQAAQHPAGSRVLPCLSRPTAPRATQLHVPDQRRWLLALPSLAATDPDFPALVMLDALLCGVTTSGFFASGPTPDLDYDSVLGTTLVKTGLVSNVAGGVLPTRDGFMWPIRLEYSAQTRHEHVVEALHAAFARLHTCLMAPISLERVVKGLRAQLTFSLESHERRAWALASWQAIAGVEVFKHLPLRLANVTAEDLQRVARSLLWVPEPCATAALATNSVSEPA